MQKIWIWGWGKMGKTGVGPPPMIVGPSNCDKHPCLAPNQILQLGYISVRFSFSFYFIAVHCKIWEEFDFKKKWIHVRKYCDPLCKNYNVPVGRSSRTCLPRNCNDCPDSVISPFDCKQVSPLLFSRLDVSWGYTRCSRNSVKKCFFTND
jgi:hypothetical protein